MANSINGSMVQVYPGEATRTIEEIFKDRLNILDFSGADSSGSNSSVAAIKKAISQIPNGGTLYFPSGRYAIDSEISIVGKSDFTLTTDSAILDGSGFDYRLSKPMFHFSGSDGQSSKVTQNVSRQSNIISVENGSLFKPGDWAVLASTELFLGIDGKDGFSPNYKGEWVYIRNVIANTIYLDHVTYDEYGICGHSVHLRQKRLAENITFRGFRTIGVGRSAYFSGSQSGDTTGPQAIYGINVRGFSIENCRSKDHSTSVFAFTRSVDVSVFNCRMVGRDLTTPSNQGEIQSERFVGATFDSCYQQRVMHCYGEGLRRMVDCGSTGAAGTTAIGRKGDFSHNTAFRCLQGLGSHIGDYLTYTGNVISQTAGGAIGVRGRNSRILNNTAFALGASEVENPAFTLGGGDNMSWQDGTIDSGDWEVSYNRISGAGKFLTIEGDFGHGVMRGNEGLGLRSDAVYLRARRWTRFEIDGGVYDASNRGSLQSAGLRQHAYLQDRQITRARPGIIRVNTTLLNFDTGVVLNGGAADTPAQMVEISSTFDRIENVAVRLGASQQGEDNGYFGERISLAGSTLLNRPRNGLLSVEPNHCAACPHMEGVAMPGLQHGLSGYVSDNPADVTPAGTHGIGSELIWSATGERFLCTVPGTGNPFSRIFSTSLAYPRRATVNGGPVLAAGVWVALAGAGPSGTTLRARIEAVSQDGLDLMLDRAVSTAVTNRQLTNAAPTFQATLSLSPNLEASKPQTLPIRSDSLSLKSTAVALASNAARVLLIGDSWMERPEIPNAIGDRLYATYGGRASDGWLSARPVTRPGNVKSSQTGVWQTWDASTGNARPSGLRAGIDGGLCFSTGAAGTRWQWSDVVGTRFTAYVTDTNGVFRIRANSSAYQTIVGEGTGNLRLVTIPLSGAGTNTVDIDLTGNPSGATVAFAGFRASSENKGIEIVRAGHGGLRGLHIPAYAADMTAIAHDISPHIGICILGNNDYRSSDSTPENYIAGLQSLVASFPTDTAWIFVAPPRTNSSSIAKLMNYQEELIRWCQSRGYEYYNAYGDWPDWTTSNSLGRMNGNIHLSATGANELAKELNWFL